METGKNEQFAEEPVPQSIVINQASLTLDRDGWYLAESQQPKTTAYVSHFVDAEGKAMSPQEISQYLDAQPSHRVAIELTEPVVFEKAQPGRPGIYTYTGRFIPESS